MSQYWDVQAGAVYEDPNFVARMPDPSYGDGSGFAQVLTALGTGYLSRRLDIDLQQRMQGNMPGVSINGTGPRMGVAGALQPGQGEGGSMGLLTIGALALGFYLLIKG